MNTYEFITPSDTITFKADDDKVAYFCSVYLGDGKAGCRKIETDERIPTILMFSKDPEKDIKDFIGDDPKIWLENNKERVANCFLSFSYASPSEREEYDKTLSFITDPEKIEAYKRQHEDENRTSMSKWVQSAWKSGQGILKSIEK